jgi:hypothetical protein
MCVRRVFAPGVMYRTVAHALLVPRSVGCKVAYRS